MLAMRFDSFAADTKRLCDPANAVTGANQRKDMQFPIRQITQSFIAIEIAPDKFVDRKQGNLRTNVNLIVKHFVDGTQELVSAAGFHPIARRADTKRTFRVGCLSLCGCDQDLGLWKLSSQIFNPHNSVAVFVKRLSDNQVRPVALD